MNMKNNGNVIGNGQPDVGLNHLPENHPVPVAPSTVQQENAAGAVPFAHPDYAPHQVGREAPAPRPQKS